MEEKNNKEKNTVENNNFENNNDYEKSLWFVKKLKEDYKELQKKENITIPYEELDKRFSLTTIIQQHKIVYKNEVLNFILYIISDNLYKMLELYNYILTPNPSSVLAVKESSFFNEEEKKEIEKHLVKTISFTRSLAKIRSNLYDVKNKEKIDYDEFFKKTINLFDEHIVFNKKLYEKMSSSWLKEKEEEKTDYAF